MTHSAPIKFSQPLRILGITSDISLPLQQHIFSTYGVTHLELRQIGTFYKILTTDATKVFVFMAFLI